MVMQQPGKYILFLEYQLAAEENRAREFLNHQITDLLELIDQIDTELVAILGVPAQTDGEIHKAF